MAENQAQWQAKNTEINLDRARATYVSSRKRNDVGLGYVSERYIKDESFKSARDRYMEARHAHLTALAHAHGPDRAIDFAKAEKRNLGTLKLHAWEKAILYIGIGAAVAGATWGIGPLTLLSGIAASYGINTVFKRINFLGWRDDSPEVETARQELQAKWKSVEAEGLTYEQFIKRERKAVRKYSKQIGKDRRTRLYVRGTVSAVALGATGLRPGLLLWFADDLNNRLGAGIGEKLVYGDRWVQKFVKGIVIPLIEGITHPISVAQASPYQPEVIDAEGKRFADIHWPNESMTLVDLANLEKTLPAALAWAEKAVDEYARTMDMHDDTCVKQLAAMKEVIHQMKIVQEDLARGRGSFLKKMAMLNTKVPGELTQHNVKILLKEKEVGRALLNVDHGIDDVRRGSDVVAMLGGGKVFVTGTVQEIKAFFKNIGIEFATPDHWKMNSRSARMLMELYRDIQKNPQLKKGLIITAGDDGDGLQAKHSSTGGHPTGDAFDMLPKGEISREYIQAMYAMMYENMLIAHHDPRVIEYFHMKIAQFEATGNAEMKEYYEGRLRWAQNPFARQYYEFIYEPGTSGPPGIESEVKAHIMKEFGISAQEVGRFMQLKYGNQALTTGEHFHIWPPAEDRYWRSDPTSYMGPDKRGAQPVVASL